MRTKRETILLERDTVEMISTAPKLCKASLAGEALLEKTSFGLCNEAESDSSFEFGRDCPQFQPLGNRMNESSDCERE